VTDDFFDLGADSLHTVELLDAIDETFGHPLAAHVLLDGATVERMARAVREPVADDFASIVAVQAEGERPPLFLVMRGGTVISTRKFVPALGPDQPLFGLWVPAMHGPAHAAGGVEDIAAQCVRALRSTRPSGPYFLFGHSLGGLVAYEIARQLAEGGDQVGLVVLADVVHPRTVPSRLRNRWDRASRQLARVPKLFTRRGLKKAVRLLRLRSAPAPVEYVPGTDQPIDLEAADQRERDYTPRPAVSPVLLLTTRQVIDNIGSDVLGWEPLITDDWTVCEVPGSHDSMLGEPHVHVLAALLAEHLRRAQDAFPGADFEPAP
jgi:thioesterase domain-containing protein